jgi:hypothetical protein
MAMLCFPLLLNDPGLAGGVVRYGTHTYRKASRAKIYPTPPVCVRLPRLWGSQSPHLLFIRISHSNPGGNFQLCPPPLPLPELGGRLALRLEKLPTTSTYTFPTIVLYAPGETHSQMRNKHFVQEQQRAKYASGRVARRHAARVHAF